MMNAKRIRMKVTC